MKKILFAIITVACLAFVGCEKKGLDILSIDATKLDDTVEKCWVYTQTTKTGDSVTAHLWGTEQQVVMLLQAAAKVSQESGIKVLTTYKATQAADAESCMLKDF